MALTEQQRKAREGKLTASRVGVLMTGSDEQLLNLWREMVGDPDYVPPNLDDIWHVKLGETTEKLNLDWIERDVGKITGRGKVFQHPEIEWAASTLDGWIEDRACPVEAKHNNGFEKFEVVVARYLPQVHWQMLCTDAEECGLSVIRGTSAPRLIFIERDAEYMGELEDRAYKFMTCVRNLRAPVGLPPPPTAFEVAALRTVDMSDNEDWKVFAASWLENRVPAATFDKVAKALKNRVGKDVKEAYGHGVKITRASNGALTIKEFTNG